MNSATMDHAPSGLSGGGDRGESAGMSSIIRATQAVLRRRWRTLATIVGVTFVLILAAVMMLTPRFEARTRIKIDPSPSTAMGQMREGGYTLPDQSVVDTEVSVMRSRDIAVAVVRKLRLVNDREFAGKLPALPARAAPAVVDERVGTVADALLRNLFVVRDKSTYIIDLGFRSTNAAKAAAIANSFADSYIESSLDRRTGTAARQTQFLDQRLSTLSQQAQAADSRLAQYRASTGIVQGGGATVTDQQISALASQLSSAESEAAAARSKVSVARSQIRSGGISAVSAVLNSNVIASLRQQRATLVQDQSEVLTRYGPKHPNTLKVSQQLASIEQQINDEAQRIIGGLESEASAAEARAGSLRSDMARLRGQQAVDTRSSAMSDSYQRQADAANTAYNKLAEQAQSSDQVQRSSLSQAQVIEAAVPPPRPTSPNKPLLLAAGLLFALVLGTGTVGMQEVMSAGLRNLSDIEQMGLPALATVPRLTPAQLMAGEHKLGSPADLMIERPMSSYAESFRVIRRSLQASQKRPRTIAIVSTLPDEGKTTSALSLARVTALSGERTLIIDTDLRRAGLKQLTGLTAEVGLVELLQQGGDPSRAIVADAVPNLDVIQVSASSFLPEDLFSGNAMADLLEVLGDRYDQIILDTPPLLGVADSRTIAKLADAVLLVIKWNATPRSAIRTALNWLELDDANVAGAVFSMVEPSSEALGALYYSRKYAEYYQTN